MSSGDTAVVIPVKNRPALVGLAIKSVQQQTRPVDEIVVVDDASDDDTRDVVKSLAAADHRIKLIENMRSVGASAARNQGILATKRTWIAFLDSDDLWLPRKHELQMQALLHASGAIAAFGGWKEPTGDAHPPGTITSEMLRGRNWAGPTSVAVVRRDKLLVVGGFDSTLPSCQDWDLWMRLSAHGAFVVVDEPLMTFNTLHTIRISRNRSAVLAGHAEVFRRALAGVNGLKRLAISALHARRMAEIHAWDFDDPKRAIVPAMHALLIAPSRATLTLARAVVRQAAALTTRPSSRRLGANCR
jgi:glycosyltransferase involved in cell wall biosynthesis